MTTAAAALNDAETMPIPMPADEALDAASTGPQKAMKLTSQGMTVREAARVLHVAPSTIVRWRQKEEAKEEQATRRREPLSWAWLVLFALVTLALVALAAEMGTIAWR